MRRAAGVLLAVLAAARPAPARAWELETSVGLTDRAALASRLDAWLRARGLSGGLYETIGLLSARQPVTRALDDRAIVDELERTDAVYGVTPDGARQPALAWLLGGAALEGARMDRVRNHFLNPRTGEGLAEAGTGSERARVGAMLDGSGSVRGIFTGANFDGTGMRADRWLDARENELSRPRFLDELARSASAERENERQAALARALLCAGAIAHVLEAVGDPAHARGDFTVNYVVAGAPFERRAAEHYGLGVPLPAPAAVLGPVPARLAWFITAPDGSGLGNLVGRSFLSPATMPDGDGALPEPAVTPGAAARGTVAGPLTPVLAAYERDSDGVRYALAPAAVAEAVDALLPRIARRAAQLLDFLFRDVVVLTPGEDGALELTVGDTALKPGRVALYVEQLDGRRVAALERATQGGAAGQKLLDVTAAEARAFGGARRVVALYRGTDANDEPVVGYAVAAER